MAALALQGAAMVLRQAWKELRSTQHPILLSAE